MRSRHPGCSACSLPLSCSAQPQLALHNLALCVSSTWVVCNALAWAPVLPKCSLDVLCLYLNCFEVAAGCLISPSTYFTADCCRSWCLAAGMPLSVFCYSRATALLFVLLVNPVACLAAACYLRLARLSPSSPGSSSSRPVGLADTYRQLLLAPQHWFAIWRHNCVLMGCHALATGSSSYSLEDKGAFLLQGQRLGLPVSPFYQAATVFVKHKSVEGGMGINVFK